MKYDDNFIKTKIIPHLFFTRRGDRLFPTAKTYFDDIDISWEDYFQNIQQENMNVTVFWEELIGILSIIYEDSVEVDDLITTLRDNRDKILDKLLIFRFEYEFAIDEMFSITKIDLMKQFIEEKFETGRNLIIENNETIRILLVESKIENGYVEPFVPGKINFYPVSLMKIDKNNNNISIQGYKKNRQALQNQINSYDENLLSKYDIVELATLRFDPSYIFVQFQEKNIFVKKIKLKCSYFNLNLSVTGNNSVLDINEFINPEFVFNDIADLLIIKEIQFIYPYEVKEDKEIKDVVFKLVIEDNKQIRDGIEEKYFKIHLQLVFRYKNIKLEELEEELTKKIESLGLKINKAYKMPNSYYFSNLVNSPDSRKKQYYNILKEDDESKSIIDCLLEKNVISEFEEAISLNTEKFSKLVAEILNSLKGERICQSSEYFEILNATNEKRRVSIRIKLYRDEKQVKYNDYHNVLFGFNTKYSKNNKIHNVILSGLNVYQILRYYLDNDSNEILYHLHHKIKMYITYNYHQLLKKESGHAHHWLTKYSDNPKEFKDIDSATRSGYFVEENINVLLKLLFGNYLSIGGKNEPDGFICLKDNEAYIVDSKQHKKLLKGELVKVRDYALDYQKNEKIYSIKGGMLVITKGVIENGSLNASTRDSILKDMPVSLNFMSVEFILNLYEIFTKKSHLGTEIPTYIRDCGLKVIEKSSEAKTTSELTEIESNAISNLYQCIEQLEKHHYPSKKESL